MSRNKTRKEQFLEEMEKVIPWGTFSEIIGKKYNKTSKGGRPKKELILMLKIYFLQQWYNLGDEEVEEAIVDSNAFIAFTGLPDYGTHVPCPDSTTILRFRHFLEDNDLQKKLFGKVNKIFESHGYIHKKGTIVDSTIIKASSSTKNKQKKRDGDMSSTRKNNNFFFGAKTHIGVDTKHGLIHTIYVTTAKVSDRKMFHHCLHGEEQAAFGDKAYISKEEKKKWRKEGRFWGITDKAGRGKTLSNSQKKRNKKLSSLRAKVEHPFGVIKNQWKHRTVRYKGLKKNAAQWFMLAILHNLYKMRKQLILRPL